MISLYIKKLRFVIKRVTDEKWMHDSLFQTIAFNFKYLPLRQAVHLPIFLHKVNAKDFHGRIKILSNVEPGIIKIGQHTISIFADSGTFINGSGEIVFEKTANIGGGTFMSIGSEGKLYFGDKFTVTGEMKLVCYNKITFGKSVLVGWECRFQDKDFHQLCTPDMKILGEDNAPINIGDYCWFAQRCSVFKGTTLQKRTVVASNSLLNKKYDKSYCMLAGTPARIVKENVMLHH